MQAGLWEKALVNTRMEARLRLLLRRPFDDPSVMILMSCGILGVHCSCQTSSSQWNRQKPENFLWIFQTTLKHCNVSLPTSKPSNSWIPSSKSITSYTKAVSLAGSKKLTQSQWWKRSVSSRKMPPLIIAVSKLISVFSGSNWVQSLIINFLHLFVFMMHLLSAIRSFSKEQHLMTIFQAFICTTSEQNLRQETTLQIRTNDHGMTWSYHNLTATMRHDPTNTARRVKIMTTLIPKYDTAWSQMAWNYLTWPRYMTFLVRQESSLLVCNMVDFMLQ